MKSKYGNGGNVQKWTEFEVKFVIDNAQFLTNAQLAQMLGRTELSIRGKVNGLNLKRPAKVFDYAKKIACGQMTLCWDCANYNEGCSWTRDFEPVEGWEAESTVIYNDNGNIDSFLVISCPKFVKG